MKIMRAPFAASWLAISLVVSSSACSSSKSPNTTGADASAGGDAASNGQDAAAPDAGKPTYTCTSTVGTGSGMFTIDATNANSGDVICIAAGTYSYAEIANLTNVTIVPSGPVAFSGSIDINANNNVTIDGTALAGITYGFTFAGYNGFAIETNKTNNTDLTIKGVYLNGTSGIDGNNQGNITYDGTEATLLFSRLVMDTIKITGGGAIFAGTYQDISTYNNVTIGLTIRNVVVINDVNDGTIRVNGSSIFQFLFENWNVTGETELVNADQGILNVSGGYGTVRDFYRDGGWGYIGRIVIGNLNSPADFYGYNIIDIDGQNYGTFDLRVAMNTTTAGQMPIYGGNAHLYNITTGNKPTTNTFISPIAVLYGFIDASGQTYTMEMKNCFSFDNQKDASAGAEMLTYVNFGTAMVDASNNLEVDGAIGSLPPNYLVDQTSCVPAAGSPLIGAGTPIALTATDIYGKSRGSSYDIGAAQH